MHPVEHMIYFAGIFIFALIPSHPLHMLFIAMRLGLGPAQGHTGFDKIVTGKDSTVDIGIYNHYLHHRFPVCVCVCAVIVMPEKMEDFLNVFC